jgi:hypothetical protein
MFQSSPELWHACGVDLGLGHELDARVAEARGGLSANDDRILAFVREHLEELAFHTADSLAQRGGGGALRAPARVRLVPRATRARA